MKESTALPNKRTLGIKQIRAKVRNKGRKLPSNTLIDPPPAKSYNKCKKSTQEWGGRKMKLQIAGKHLDLGEAFQTHCKEAVDKVNNKYSIEPTSCAVVLSKKEHHQFEAEISLHLGRGVYIRARAQSGQVYECFDAALTKVQEKIAKHKTRLDDHHKHHDNHAYQKLSVMDVTLDGTWEGVEGTQQPSIIAENTKDIAVLSVSEAAMRLDLEDTGFLVFRNKTHGRVNLLYRLPDGHISWIDPQN